MKKNSILTVTIVIIALLVGLLGGYIISDKLVNKQPNQTESDGKTTDNKNEQIISDTVKINTVETIYDLKLLQKIDTTDSYAYVFLKNDNDGLDLYELHKNSPSTKIFSCSSGCSISEVQIANKKLYFNLWYYHEGKSISNLVSIDLETSSFNNIFTTSDLLTVNYTVTEDYLFVGAIGKDSGETKPGYHLKRYNLKTGAVDLFLEGKNMRWSNILSFNNNIYISAYVYDKDATYINPNEEIEYGTDVLKYYSMQLDSSNLKEISENDYNNAFNSVNYIIPDNRDGKYTVMYDNELLTVSSGEHWNLYFNGNKIFTAKGRILTYFKHHINNYNEILFEDCVGLHACETEKFYTYNFKTKELKSVTPQESEFANVIYLK